MVNCVQNILKSEFLINYTTLLNTCEAKCDKMLLFFPARPALQTPMFDLLAIHYIFSTMVNMHYLS